MRVVVLIIMLLGVIGLGEATSQGTEINTELLVMLHEGHSIEELEELNLKHRVLSVTPAFSQFRSEDDQQATASSQAIF